MKYFPVEKVIICGDVYFEAVYSLYCSLTGCMETFSDPHKPELLWRYKLKSLSIELMIQ